MNMEVGEEIGVNNINFSNDMNSRDQGGDSLNLNVVRNSIDKMKLEAANEFDANITQDEKIDGTTVENLIQRAQRKQEQIDEKFRKQ